MKYVSKLFHYLSCPLLVLYQTSGLLDRKPSQSVGFDNHQQLKNRGAEKKTVKSLFSLKIQVILAAFSYRKYQ